MSNKRPDTPPSTPDESAQDKDNAETPSSPGELRWWEALFINIVLFILLSMLLFFGRERLQLSVKIPPLESTVGLALFGLSVIHVFIHYIRPRLGDAPGEVSIPPGIKLEGEVLTSLFDVIHPPTITSLMLWLTVVIMMGIVVIGWTFENCPIPVPNPRLLIAELMDKEKEAVLEEDFELIEEIFKPDATKTDASESPPMEWNARSRYEETFESEDHHEIHHTNLIIEIKNDDMATATNDSCGRFTITATNQEISYSSPRSNKWTFERDDNGRWWITDLTYGIQSSSPDHLYEFEDETDGCWRVRIDHDEPQGNPPMPYSEMGYKSDGSLKFPFNLSEISQKRAQVMHENMPFAGEFSAYVYIPENAPDDLVASFFAMELGNDPWNYHGIETGEGQIQQLFPGQWTEVRWEDDVSQWEPIVHLLGIEIRQESGGFYDGYVLIDNIDIKSK